MKPTLKESLFENIRHLLQQAVPDGWDKLLLYGEVDEEQCYSLFYVYPKGASTAIFSNNLPEVTGIDEETLADLMDELDDCLISLWEEAESLGDKAWTTATLTFGPEGPCTAEFAKTNLQKGSIEGRLKAWVNEHVK